MKWSIECREVYRFVTLRGMKDLAALVTTRIFRREQFWLKCDFPALLDIIFSETESNDEPIRIAVLHRRIENHTLVVTLAEVAHVIKAYEELPRHFGVEGQVQLAEKDKAIVGINNSLSNEIRKKDRHITATANLCATVRRVERENTVLTGEATKQRVAHAEIKAICAKVACPECGELCELRPDNQANSALWCSKNAEHKALAATAAGGK